jgi:cytochrome b
MTTTRHPLWDIPTRLFHWSLVVLIPLAWWSAEEERYDLHEWVGYTLLVLIVARIIWGFIGSQHARFTDFLRGPGAVMAYVRGEGGDSAGHNPLGGWGVVAMITLILLQAVSGLFNSEDAMFHGPLYYAVDTGFRDTMGEIHEVAFNVLVAFLVFHLLAICYYQLRKRQPLLRAMVFGSAPEREGRAPVVALWRYLILVMVLAGLLWLGLSQAPKPQVLW